MWYNFRAVEAAIFSSRASITLAARHQAHVANSRLPIQAPAGVLE
jgi:hypothetical protein